MPIYQKAVPSCPSRTPLIPFLLIETPFEQVAMDTVGPLPKSSTGYQRILNIMDYVTWYPEVVPMWTLSTLKVAEEFFESVFVGRTPLRTPPRTTDRPGNQLHVPRI